MQSGSISMQVDEQGVRHSLEVSAADPDQEHNQEVEAEEGARIKRQESHEQDQTPDDQNARLVVRIRECPCDNDAGTEADILDCDKEAYLVGRQPDVQVGNAVILQFTGEIGAGDIGFGSFLAAVTKRLASAEQSLAVITADPVYQV